MPILITVDDKILKCPRCGSDQLEESKKGFDEGLGTLGWLMFGPIGLMAGEIDSDKMIITCLDCGYKFKLK
jgi:transcription elongation factor Elf1